MARPRTVRMRPLTPAQEGRLKGLRSMSQLLDSAFVVPGTSYRIGLDPIVGLVPILGDLVTPLFAVGLLLQARDLGVPRVVQLRMVFNVALDAVLGAIPIAGDLFDFAWKANDRNLALLERHAREERRASVGDWLFVGMMIAVVLALAALPFLLLTWIFGIVRRAFF